MFHSLSIIRYMYTCTYVYTENEMVTYTCHTVFLSPCCLSFCKCLLHIFYSYWGSLASYILHSIAPLSLVYGRGSWCDGCEWWRRERCPLWGWETSGGQPAINNSSSFTHFIQQQLNLWTHTILRVLHIYEKYMYTAHVHVHVHVLRTVYKYIHVHVDSVLLGTTVDIIGDELWLNM